MSAPLPGIEKIIRKVAWWPWKQVISFLPNSMANVLKGIYERVRYSSVTCVHDLPPIFHYWSNKYLRPKMEMFGFSNPEEFFLKYLRTLLQSSGDGMLRFVSLGAGNCDLEVRLARTLIKEGYDRFRIECIDINRLMVSRGRTAAESQKVIEYLLFTCDDVNGWRPSHRYDAILANQVLHHLVRLEDLFDTVHDALDPNGYFLVSDMIGRNGHRRWPEALELVKEFWQELPARYKFNNAFQRQEKIYDNFDFSVNSFEGIRAQDILPLLIDRFNFEFFLGFANIVFVFIERSFGPNFDPTREFDRFFIDRVHHKDEIAIELGQIKPTQMTAALKKSAVKMSCYKHLTPEFCLRPTKV